MRVCSVIDCGGKHEGRGLCKKHYMQWWAKKNKKAKYLARLKWSKSDKGMKYQAKRNALRRERRKTDEAFRAKQRTYERKYEKKYRLSERYKKRYREYMRRWMRTSEKGKLRARLRNKKLPPHAPIELLTLCELLTTLRKELRNEYK